MPFAIHDVTVVHMISVHDLPEGIHVEIPSVLPGKFWFPAVDAPQTQIDRCQVSFREPGMQKPINIQYAVRRELNKQKYLLLNIPDAKTIRHGTEQQRFDEWKTPLQPDVERAFLHVRAQELANEIENQRRHLGIVTIKGDEATPEEVKDALKIFQKWVMDQIRATQQSWARLGQHEVTSQSVLLAAGAYKKGWIPAIPEWASIVTDGQSEDLFACNVCGTQLRKGTVRCKQCAAIYDWPKAFEHGIVRREDVPPQFREACGLEALVEPKRK